MTFMDDTEQLISALETRSGKKIEVIKNYAGEVFIEEGSHTPVYIIKSGTCRVFLKDQLGGEVVLGVFGPGSTLGDISRLNDQSASANMVAQTDIELYLLCEENFELLWDISPQTSKELYAKMCQRLTNTNENLGKNVNELIQLKRQLQIQVNAQLQSIQEKNEALKEKNESLSLLMETRDNFLNMAIHDLRSPLSIIKGSLELLEHHSMEPSSLEHIKSVIERNTNNMLSLVNDLLGISKINSMQMSLEKTTVDIEPLLREEVLGQPIIARQKDIEILMNLQSNLPKLHVDSRRISEILQNLLSNAIKFTERGQKIFLKAWGGANHFFIEVKDEGQGIPAEEIPKLFKSFERISTKATEGEASTGLGLSIVKKLVELHDGHISVESQPDVGSTFTVQLPLGTP